MYSPIRWIFANILLHVGYAAQLIIFFSSGVFLVFLVVVSFACGNVEILVEFLGL